MPDIKHRQKSEDTFTEKFELFPPIQQVQELSESRKEFLRAELDLELGDESDY